MVKAADAINVITPGELVGIVGANGSGKTTFESHYRLSQTRSGRIMIQGRDSTGLPPRQITARSGAFVSDSAALYGVERA